jgi:hypothetical protein
MESAFGSHPQKQLFETLDAWKATYPGAEFKEETPKEHVERKMKRWVENNILGPSLYL